MVADGIDLLSDPATTGFDVFLPDSVAAGLGALLPEPVPLGFDLLLSDPGTAGVGFFLSDPVSIGFDLEVVGSLGLLPF